MDKELKAYPDNKTTASYPVATTDATDYKSRSLTDLVAYTVETSMNIIKRSITRKLKQQATQYTPGQQSRIDAEIKKHMDYYIEFFNCCRFEQFAGAISGDVREMVIKLHSRAEIRELLEAQTTEDYETATLFAARQMKPKILAFWDEYMGEAPERNSNI